MYLIEMSTSKTRIHNKKNIKRLPGMICNREKKNSTTKNQKKFFRKMELDMTWLITNLCKRIDAMKHKIIWDPIFMHRKTNFWDPIFLHQVPKKFGILLFCIDSQIFGIQIICIRSQISPNWRFGSQIWVIWDRNSPNGNTGIQSSVHASGFANAAWYST